MMTLLPMAFALTILSICLPLVALSGQQMVRSERRRSAQRASADRDLIEALENKANALENKASAFQTLSEAQDRAIAALEERLRICDSVV